MLPERPFVHFCQTVFNTYVGFTRMPVKYSHIEEKNWFSEEWDLFGWSFNPDLRCGELYIFSFLMLVVLTWFKLLPVDYCTYNRCLMLQRDNFEQMQPESSHRSHEWWAYSSPSRLHCSLHELQLWSLMTIHVFMPSCLIHRLLSLSLSLYIIILSKRPKTFSNRIHLFQKQRLLLKE